jgi:hypothetical protein
MLCAEIRRRLLFGLGMLFVVILYAQAQDESTCIPGSYPYVYAGSGVLAPTPGAPFSANVKWTYDQQLADGNAIHTVEWTRQARDSAGRTRTERAQGCYLGEDGKPHARMDVSVLDPIARETLFWDAGLPGSSRVVHVTHWGPPAVAPAVTPANPVSAASDASPATDSTSQAVTTSPPVQSAVQEHSIERRILLGTQTVGGVSADGSRTVWTVPQGSEGNQRAFEWMREVWYSTGLRITVKAVFDDPRKGRSTYEFQNVSRSEPDPSLFTPPAGYKRDDAPVR